MTKKILPLFDLKFEIYGTRKYHSQSVERSLTAEQ